MFQEDLTVFFADFGINAVVGGVTVRAIYDEPGLASPLGVAGAMSNTPQITLPTASVPAPPYHVAVTVPGQGSFRVIEHIPDGTGISVLLLERTA